VSYTAALDFFILFTVYVANILFYEGRNKIY